jgi:hypothetical protein
MGIVNNIGTPPLSPTMDAINDHAQEWGAILDTIEYLVPIALISLVLHTACKRKAADDLEMMVMVMIS